jgi:hypothetical protein
MNQLKARHWSFEKAIVSSPQTINWPEFVRYATWKLTGDGTATGYVELTCQQRQSAMCNIIPGAEWQQQKFTDRNAIQSVMSTGAADGPWEYGVLVVPRWKCHATLGKQPDVVPPPQAVLEPASPSCIVVTGTNNMVTQNFNIITMQPIIMINLGHEICMDQLQLIHRDNLVSALENPLDLLVGTLPEVSWFNQDKPHQQTMSAVDGIVVFRATDAAISQQVSPAAVTKLLCGQLQNLIEWAVTTYPSAFDWKAKVGLKQITDLVMNGMPQIIESSVPVHKFLVRWGEDGSYDPADVAGYVVEQIVALTAAAAKRGRMRTFAEISQSEFVCT